MFNLEEKISEWRKQMLAAGIQSPVPLEELEIHLREDTERQMQSGLNAQQALEFATQRIGMVNVLGSEFASVGGARTTVMRGIKIFLTTVFAATVVTLNIYLASELQAICLIDGLLLSLVLPLLAQRQSSNDAGNAKLRLRTAWTGQIFIGFGGLLIMFTTHPVFGLMFAMVSCLAFVLKLRGQVRAVVADS